MALTSEQQEAVLTLFRRGATQRDVRDTLGVQIDEINGTAAADPLFATALAQARSAGYDAMADELLHAHQDDPDVQRARLRSDNLRWLLSKRKAQLYGDRLDVSVTQQLDLSGALQLAQDRMRARYLVQVEDAQVTDSVDVKRLETTDK